MYAFIFIRGCIIKGYCDVIDDYFINDYDMDVTYYYCSYHSSLPYSPTTAQATYKNHTNNINYFVQVKPSTSSSYDIKADMNTAPYDK